MAVKPASWRPPPGEEAEPVRPAAAGCGAAAGVQKPLPDRLIPKRAPSGYRTGLGALAAAPARGHDGAVIVSALSRRAETGKDASSCGPNRLRALLDANQPSVGTHLLSTWPTLVELVGQTGQYDYVEFTAEYSPFDMHDLDNLGRALELKDLCGMIKVEQTMWTHQAMRAIGSGFQSILFADVRTVADAHACVAAVRAEDSGVGRAAGGGDAARCRHGARWRLPGLCRSAGRGGDRADGGEAGVRRGPGCDPVGEGDRHGAVPGGSDYSMSLGLTGQRNHPDVKRAERKTIETALAKGLHPRVSWRHRAGGAVSGDGCEAFLHRLGCAYPA